MGTHAAVRHCGHAPVSAYAAESRHHRPALLVGVSDAMGVFTAVEVTYLAPNAHRAADLRLNRKTSRRLQVPACTMSVPA